MNCENEIGNALETVQEQTIDALGELNGLAPYMEKSVEQITELTTNTNIVFCNGIMTTSEIAISELERTNKLINDLTNYLVVNFAPLIEDLDFNNQILGDIIC